MYMAKSKKNHNMEKNIFEVNSQKQYFINLSTIILFPFHKDECFNNYMFPMRIIIYA